jgi:alkylation response protein AidB-like acyl-CoA dehydrogenase
MSTVAPLPWPAFLGAEERTRYADARTTARDYLAPIAQAGSPGRVNRDLIEALAEHGLLQQLFPSQLGGAQPDRVSAADLCLVREALATESTEAETAFAMQGLGAYPILEAGSPELAAEWIPRIAAGAVVPAFALTEAGAGSDAAALAMRAEPDGVGYRLIGTKTWISNAPDADVYSVFARTSGESGGRGVTAFVVPGDASGLSGDPIDLLAPHPIGSLVFDEVPVGADQVLGEVDHGFRVALATLTRFRPSVGAFAVGMAQAAIEMTQRYVDERQAFGGPLRDLQVVAHKLAAMAVATHVARLAVYDAAMTFDNDLDRPEFRSSAAKLQATETAQQVVDDAMQLHGAVALERAHPLEHLYREVRAPRIYEGASDVQLEIIARQLAVEAST